MSFTVELPMVTMFLAPMRSGDTPVPIPNTMVKTKAADGTALETVWESRWLPGLQNREENEVWQQQDRKSLFSCAVAARQPDREQSVRMYLENCIL